MKMKISVLVEEHRLKSRPDLHVVLGFDKKNKTWKFLGWSCPKCQTGLKSIGNATKHRCSAQKLRQRNSNSYLDETEIKTVSGTPFRVVQV